MAVRCALRAVGLAGSAYIARESDKVWPLKTNFARQNTQFRFSVSRNGRWTPEFKRPCSCSLGDWASASARQITSL
ncbi:hypothetical protein GJAV_G00213450 [Gymnothorax javanicus]|nr:hypothetical protein GJAV_G00213450 [Gymnothorax javanicus]